MDQLKKEALDRFEKVFEAAASCEAEDVAVMSLATADVRGRPSVRTVGYTGLVDGCFSFFANEESGKGKQLAVNPWVALSFFWPVLDHQVVIEGKASVLATKDADRLWLTRPRDATMMAWASMQSREGRDLDERYREALERFKDERVPRPEHWLAFAVEPHRIEFWRGGWRLRRDKDSYTHTEDGWRRRQLNP